MNAPGSVAQVRESAALLDRLSRHRVVESHPTALAGANTPVEISGVALRDRDDNVWGAALMIRRRTAPA